MWGKTFDRGVHNSFSPYLTPANPMWGCFVFLLLLLALFVGNVLKAFFNSSQSDNSNIKIIPLSQEDIDNSRRLLRYATSILAFL